MSRHFGPIRQVGYVVHDLDDAIRHWTMRVGAGPFLRFAEAPIRDFRYRGEPCAAKVAFALGQSGDVQIELIQPLDRLPSLYREHLERCGEGPQHVAYWTDRFDALCALARTQGLEEVLSGWTGDPEGRFAYFLGGGALSGCIEISALSARKRELFDRVAEHARSWNGRPEEAVIPMDATS